MKIPEKLRDRREEILRVVAKHGAGNVLVFGSVARGDETAGSDVDLLVDVSGEPTPWFPGGLVADLEELLGQRDPGIGAERRLPVVRPASHVRVRHGINLDDDPAHLAVLETAAKQLLEESS